MKNNSQHNNTKEEITLRPRFILQVFLSRVMVPYIILLAIFIVDALDGEIDDGYLDTNFYIVITIMTSILAGIFLPYRKAIFRNTSYIFHKDKIVCNKDFPFKSQKIIKYSDIKGVTVKQRWIQKLYGTGTLLVSTKNSDNYSFFSLDKVMEVQKLINQICKKNDAIDSMEFIK